MDDFERLQKWGVILRSGGSGVDVYRKVLSDIFSKSRDEAESLMSEIFQVGYPRRWKMDYTVLATQQ